MSESMEVTFQSLLMRDLSRRLHRASTVAARSCQMRYSVASVVQGGGRPGWALLMDLACDLLRSSVVEGSMQFFLVYMGDLRIRALQCDS